MGVELADQPAIWIIAALVLAVCWPIAQSLRHEKLHPIAAYLLFVSVMFLVAALVFMVVIRVAAALMSPTALEGAGVAVAISLLSLLPGFFAARWIVRRPQIRRMPK